MLRISLKAFKSLQKSSIRAIHEVSSLKSASHQVFPKKYGQPTAETHPHLLKPGEFACGIKLSEFQSRRENLVQEILVESGRRKHLVIVPAANKRYMSGKIPYVYRQNSDHMYLTGNFEPESCLCLEIEDSGSYKSTIFLRPKDQHKEMWDGVVTGPAEGAEFFGVDKSSDIREINSYISAVCKSSSPVLWYDSDSDLVEVTKLIEDLSKTHPTQNPAIFIHRLRLVKSPAEQDLMRKTCEIASEAVNLTREWTKPGVSEHHLFAKVDYECRIRDATMLAYPPVVAAGNNATTIHYINNCQTCVAGEMVLMDAGCEYGSYCSDITRTFPVDGRFTDPQKVLYEVVLNTQKDLIQKLSSETTSLDELFEAMCLQLGKYLKEVGLIPKQISGIDLARAAYKFCPHHVSHYLGMDVHDTPTISRNISLVPGNVFTIEPGIYISATRRDVPEEFRGIGIRIEDDALVKPDGGLEILTAACKKEINEIEKNKF